MSSGGKLSLDPLFLGLTRPALVGGVTFMFFGMNFFVSVFAFLIFGTFKVFLLSIIVHIFGIFLSKNEPLAVDILVTRFQKCPNIVNRAFHNGANSYNMF